MAVVLTIPDIQAPFVHQDALAFLKALAKQVQPDYVVQIGDLADHHALSDYESDPDGMSAGDELKATIACLKKFYKAFPRVDVIIGNHDARIYRKAFAAGIPKAYIRPLEEVLMFPEGWRLNEEVEIDGVIYEHGHQLGGGGMGVYKKAVDSNMRNTVLGHHHSLAGIQYFANKRHLCFTMVTGCLMDTHSYAAAYGKKFPSKPILGAGVIVDGVPYYQPMLMTEGGRWVGKL